MQEIIIFWSEGYPDSFLYTVINLIFNEDLLSDREYSRNWKRNTGANTRPSFWAHIPAGGPLDTVAVHFLMTQNARGDPHKLVCFLVLSHSGTLILSCWCWTQGLTLHHGPYSQPSLSLYEALPRSYPCYFCFISSGHNIHGHLPRGRSWLLAAMLLHSSLGIALRNRGELLQVSQALC